MKNFKIIFFILATSFILNSCGTVKEAFDPQRKNSSDEFLIEKKSPLSMPPDFEKLPKPKTSQNSENKELDNSLETLIKETQKNNNQSISANGDSRSLEELLIYILKNN